jgi:hypothetical protein
MSGAPFKVHAVNMSALFLAFVIPSIIVNIKNIKKPFYIWLLGSVIGILLWDTLSAFVIVKRELFMGWYIIYPIGITALVSLQLLVNYINGKLPYNKSFKPTPKSGSV